jgi:hypothetical protein
METPARLVQGIRGRLVFLFLVCAGLASAQTVFLFSLDGFGHQFFTQSPAAAPLKTLKALAARGAQADGIQPAFPSTTANSHCALWTGQYGDVSHITANNQPMLPRAEHTFLDRNNGYRADQLAAEPLWVTAARRGMKTVAYQPPQAVPFLPINTHPLATTINSYQTRQIAPHLIVHRKDLTFDTATEFHFKHGPLTLKGAFAAGGLRIGGIFVEAAAAESKPPVERDLARHFSAGLYLDNPVPAVIYFRLFELREDDLLLYVSPIQELAFSQGDARSLLRAAGGVIGNSYDGSALTVAQSLETTELLARQNYCHVQWLYRTLAPRLFISYLPVPDELLHHFLGLYEKGDPSARKALEWGFTIVDRWSQEILKLVKKDDHLVIAADHGMAATYRLVNVNEALRRAGLGRVATHIYNSVLLNTADWKEGTVRDRDAVRAQVQAALEAVKDPEPVFTGFYTPEKDGAKYGIGGPAGSDLYFDLAPGYSVRDVKGELLPKLARPSGSHGFRPDREDMLASLFVVGPQFTPGSRLPVTKSIEVAPLVLRILGAIR